MNKKNLDIQNLQKEAKIFSEIESELIFYKVEIILRIIDTLRRTY